MQNRNYAAQELMSMYQSTPRMILYDKDLSTDQLDSEVHAIADMSSHTQLNPVEVVLESLINKLAERVSEESLTRSHDTVLLNAHVRAEAIERLVGQVRANDHFLTEIHEAWLRDLRGYVTHEMMNLLTTDEMVFRVAMRYRVSASSAARALKSAGRTE